MQFFNGPVAGPRSNVKGLPEGNYFTALRYSDNEPYVELRRTAKTATLARVVVKRDPEWMPDFRVGGFAHHCVNQSSQTWLFDYIDYDDTVRVNARKKGTEWGHQNTRFVEGTANYFYDYNF